MVTVFALWRYMRIKEGKSFHPRTIFVTGSNPVFFKLLKATENLINGDKQARKILRFYFLGKT